MAAKHGRKQSTSHHLRTVQNNPKSTLPTTSRKIGEPMRTLQDMLSNSLAVRTKEGYMSLQIIVPVHLIHKEKTGMHTPSTPTIMEKHFN